MAHGSILYIIMGYWIAFDIPKKRIKKLMRRKWAFVVKASCRKEKYANSRMKSFSCITLFSATSMWRRLWQLQYWTGSYDHIRLQISSPVIITAISSFYGRIRNAITATGEEKYHSIHSLLVPNTLFKPVIVLFWRSTANLCRWLYWSRALCSNGNKN